MTPDEQLLVEQVTSAHRERGYDGAIREHRSWADLSDEGRQLAFDETVKLRDLEAAMDPQGFSTTVRALLSRLRT
ncbi:MAG: hypothetical protein ACO1OB_00360 [Archangium sp.]